MNPRSRLPRLVNEVDLRGLPIGPSDAFVLSRIDGATTETDIASATGLDVSEVGRTLERLAELGAVRFEALTDSHSTTPRAPRPSSMPLIQRVVETRSAHEALHPAAALYDARELAEQVDLSDELKRQILDAFYKLETSTHYDLLKVDPTADKRTVKNAYYLIVNVFHPDRYFGKNLGSFKPKLERVFARLTEAYDCLARQATRSAYDAYLASQRKTQALDQSLSSNVEDEVAAIRERIEAEARAGLESLQSPAPAASAPAAPAPPTTSATPPTTASRPTSQKPPDPEERRRALARKLRGTLPGSQSAPAPTASPLPPAEARERAVDELKRHFEQRVTQARDAQVKRYLDNADQALASKDPISAANSLRIAATLAPENSEIAKRLADVQGQASAMLSDHYLEQAQYEERDGRMAEAARSYARAAQGKTNARVFERAAFCLLISSGDMRQAAEFARRAVALDPSDPQVRVTLARIYVGLGMKQSAIGEFERAATLAPRDDTIKDWIQRLKRGEV